MIGFTFNEIQTMELESFCRDFVTFPFDEHNNTIGYDEIHVLFARIGLRLMLA